MLIDWESQFHGVSWGGYQKLYFRVAHMNAEKASKWRGPPVHSMDRARKWYWAEKKP